MAAPTPHSINDASTPETRERGPTGEGEPRRQGLHEQLRATGTLAAQDALVRPDGGATAPPTWQSGRDGATIDLEAATLYAGVDPRLTQFVGELLHVPGEPPTAAFVSAVREFQLSHGVLAEKPGVLDRKTLAALRPEVPDDERSRLDDITNGTWSRHRVSSKVGGDAREDGTGTKSAMVRGAFLGQPVEAHPELLERLGRVQEQLRGELAAVLSEPTAAAELAHGGIVGTSGKDLGRWLGVRRAHMGWREGNDQGYHRYGMAIDINRDTNAWTAVRSGLEVGGEGANTGALTEPFDREALEVIDRASLFMTKRRAELHITTARTGAAAEAVWQRFQVASKVVSEYFGLVYDAGDEILHWEPAEQARGPQIRAALAELPSEVALRNVERMRREVHGGSWPLSAEAMVAQLQIDFRTLARHSASGKMVEVPKKTKNPRLGLMDLDRRLVRAMVAVGGLHWGACELGGKQSGDLMHFDTGTIPAALQAGAKVDP